MLKRPVLVSMGIAAVICIAFVGFMLARSRNVDESPFIMFFGLLGFPFVWFIAWIVVNAIAWGSEMKRGPERDD